MKYELKDTIEWMLSDDFRLRMKAEYWQLIIRMDMLKKLVKKARYQENKNIVDEKLIGSLAYQYGAMNIYRLLLEDRNSLLGIDLENDGIVFEDLATEY
jgi:hypothetical protein